MHLVARLVCVCLTLLLVSKAGNAAVASIGVSIHPDYPGRCWNPSTNTLHNAGEEYTDKRTCTLVRCDSDLSINMYTCSPMALNGVKCDKPGDKTKNYPYCCPKC